MNKNKIITSEGGELLPHEIGYVDVMANILAKESGINVNWIKNILIKTFPIYGIGIHRSSLLKNAPVFISGRFPSRFLYCFKPCLLEAMRWRLTDSPNFRCFYARAPVNTLVPVGTFFSNPAIQMLKFLLVRVVNKLIVHYLAGQL